MKLLVATFFVLSAIGASACDKTTILYPPSGPSGYPQIISPSDPQQPQIQNQTIEFRVTGNATGARIKYSTSVDGTVQVLTTLPFVQQVTLPSTVTTSFLSLEATPLSYGSAAAYYPYMTVQIFVNGVIFREAGSNDFLLTTLSVSGNYRRN
jgi:hypothetical protein